MPGADPQLDALDGTGRFRFVSSSSMIFAKFSKGWAPLTNLPLIKKPGVPLMPSARASATSASILFFYSALTWSASKRAMSS